MAAFVDEPMERHISTELEAEPAEQVAFLARLAGGLAHEIKNPLSTMAITLTLLEEDWERAAAVRDGETSAREMRSIKRVQTLKREVHRLEAIVREFLAFARRTHVNRSPHDLAQIVRESLEFVEPQNLAAGIHHHVDLQAGMPLVLVDEGQIRQALLNLFVNAREAMPDGGELLVRVNRVGNDAHVSVTDTGVGMSPEQMARCFDVYWSNKKGGTGLGLATTRHIVEEHGGHIEVISEPGRGTSFEFTVPLAVELAGGVDPRARTEESRDERGDSPEARRVIEARARPRRSEGEGETTA